MFIRKLCLIFTILILAIPSITFSQSIENHYSPSPGSPERKAILDAIREELKGVEKPNLPEFQYDRIPEDIKIIFVVDYIKIKEPWAWVKVKVKDYYAEIYALLIKKDGKWIVKGMVDPKIFSCPDPQECIDINHSIYKKFKETFPSAPVEIFPEEHPECKVILEALRECINTVSPESVNFIVRYLKVKNGWAWIETDPRDLEPVDALLHKGEGKWQVKNIKPCCGDCEFDPYCAKGMYHKKLMKMFPSVPKEIFPDKTR